MRVASSDNRSLLIVAAACLGVAGLVWAQGRGGEAAPTPPPNATTDPGLRGFEFRSIGPATMMGRVDDIAGAEKDPMIVYVGFATGGLWKSTDGGNHWHSQFDNMPDESIGAIGIAPSDPNVVYVGTGEANNRQSSSIGDGVWGTTDGGRHWNHLAWKTLNPSAVSWWTRQIRTSFTWRPADICSAPTRSAVCINPPTAARTGRTPSISTRTPASPTWLSIPPIPRSSMRPHSSAGAPGGATTAAALAARFGKPRTRATTGASWKGRAGPNPRTASTAALRFRSSRRSPPPFTPRWRRAPAPAPAAAPRRKAARPVGAAARPTNRQRPKRRRARPLAVPFLVYQSVAEEVAEVADAEPLPARPILTPAACSAPTMAARPGRS